MQIWLTQALHVQVEKTFLMKVGSRSLGLREGGWGLDSWSEGGAWVLGPGSEGGGWGSVQAPQARPSCSVVWLSR